MPRIESSCRNESRHKSNRLFRPILLYQCAFKLVLIHYRSWRHCSQIPSARTAQPDSDLVTSEQRRDESSVYSQSPIQGLSAAQKKTTDLQENTLPQPYQENRQYLSARGCNAADQFVSYNLLPSSPRTPIIIRYTATTVDKRPGYNRINMPATRATIG